MAKSYAQIQQQIANLQKEAEALKAKEVGGVIARIKEAIAHYGLTSEDLGLAPRGGRKGAALPASSSVKKSKTKSSAAKPTRAAKFADGTGKTWSGIGKRPDWFKAAIADGKTPEDLMVKQPN